ncbi:MAG: thioredoxin domain-containing protein [Longimicrobiales bacterium]
MHRFRIFAFAAVVTAAAASCPVPIAAQEAPPKDALQRMIDAAGMNRAKGAETATVRVYEIADFQCPFCARFATDVMGKIDSAFIKTGRVQWVFVNMPLPMHQNAWVASEAAMCAGASNRFWAMHDRLYRTQPEWAASQDPTPIFARYAKEAGVPAEPFTSCMANDRVATLITNDVIFGASARITGTPTFVINDDEQVVGIKTFEEWKDIIDAAAKKAAAVKK